MYNITRLDDLADPINNSRLFKFLIFFLSVEEVLGPILLCIRLRIELSGSVGDESLDIKVWLNVTI